MAERETLRDPEHQIIYNRILDLREDFIDLKGHVNDQHEAYTAILAQKADRRDLNLLILWKQSPTWMKIVGAAVTAAIAITAAVAERVPLPF